VSISIKHCVDRDFLDLFRADLAACAECVDLLSPFVSLSRSSNYHAALAALAARKIPVRAYVRPHREQPDTLRSGFLEAIRNLEIRGTSIYFRPGMHEKIAAIDGRILWHGSLNVLSHNDSKESMLRFDSPELVTEVLRDIGLFGISRQNHVGRSADSQAEVTPTALSCPVCEGSMRLFEEAGIWVCNDSPRCPGIRSIGAAELEAEAAAAQVQGDPNLGCPLCGSKMIVKGLLRRQIACPASECGFALEPRLSAGILRILSRRRTP